MLRFLLTAVIVVLTAVTAHANEPFLPYAGLETRGIKALSAEEIAGLREGKGMSLALAAELNGHPGPLHVLELGKGLGLSAEQREATQAVFEAMKRRAVELGKEILALEAELDSAFRRTPSEAGDVERLTVEIGEKRGALRAAHLTAHLQMNAILGPEQRARYARLRGYDSGDAQHRGHGGQRAPRH